MEHLVGDLHAGDIRGRVLEIALPEYATQFGRGVSSVNVLMAEEGNPEATIVGDPLQDAPQIPGDALRLAIAQTLQLIYLWALALIALHRILAPGGVLLGDRARPNEDLAARGRRVRGMVALHGAFGPALAGEAFGAANVEVSSSGNVLSVGVIYGLAASDFEPAELERPRHTLQVIIGLRAVKAG